MSEHSAAPEALDKTPFGQFSSGYWAGTFDVQPYSEGPVIDQALFDYISKNLYQQTDVPPHIKFGVAEQTRHLELQAEPGVPETVIGLPEQDIIEYGLDESPNGSFVMLLRPRNAYLLATGIEQRMFGGVNNES